MQFKKWLIIATCICFILGLSGPGMVKAEKPIKIAAIGPMDFDFGKLIWYGAEIAAETINKAGGINVGGKKRPVEVISINSNELVNITDAIQACNKAILINKVDCIVGAFRSEAALAMQEIAMDHKTIFIASGPSSPKLNMRVKQNYDRYKYWFRVNFNQAYANPFFGAHVKYIAEIIKKDLGIEKLTGAIIADKVAWGDGAVKGFSKMLPALGIELVKVIRVSPKATDVTAEMTALKESKAHIVIQFLTGPSGAVVGRQWGELKIPTVLTGINVLAQSKALWEATGGKGEYITSGTLFARFAATPTTLAFYDKFEKKYGEFPAHGGFSHEAVMVYKKAVERAGTIDSDAVVKALEQTDYTGASYRIVFRGKEDPFPHDVKTGPGYATVPLVQWIKGQQIAIWPYQEGNPAKGIQRFVIPPWMVKYYKK